jgi:hypothetical protein
MVPVALRYAIAGALVAAALQVVAAVWLGNEVPSIRTDVHSRQLVGTALRAVVIHLPSPPPASREPFKN